MTEKCCSYYLPKEIGGARSCALFGVCNNYGTKCPAFERIPKKKREERDSVVRAIRIVTRAKKGKEN